MPRVFSLARERTGNMGNGRWRRLMALVFVLFLALSVACSGEGEDEDEDDEGSIARTEAVVRVDSSADDDVRLAV
jgi:hypothetical protein